MKNFLVKESVYIVWLFMSMLSCKQKDTAESDDTTTAPTHTPVTVTSVAFEPLQQFIELNATSSFLQKNFVKSNLTGYIKKVNIKIGASVSKGRMLFVLKTKEAEAIGNSVNKLNPDFKFSGESIITASSNGFIAELNHQEGDYVQDGEQLAIISDSRSFAFIMNVPYEDMPYVSLGKKVEIILPGSDRITGTISSAMPVMDSITQTQTYAIKPDVSRNIPQNLVATIRVLKSSKAVTTLLPKNAVLSDETQSEFWVMKIINDSTAAKVPIKKGVEDGDKVEILSPQFSPNDKIVLTGNYGLPDTAFVIIQK